jgi:branched-chain amino acid transport system ATP-binding protein
VSLRSGPASSTDHRPRTAPGKTTSSTRSRRLAGRFRAHPLRRTRRDACPRTSGARRGLARSFQITSILRGFSGLENVALAVQARSGSSFRFFGDASAEASLNEPALASLALVGLDDRAHVPARRLAHGEKRQLEIAIALATEPKLLLLDEPLAGTGHEEGARLIATLKRLKGRYTIVLVEHDMEAVFALADRITVLVYGRVIATGTPEAVRSNPEVRSAYLGEEAA